MTTSIKSPGGSGKLALDKQLLRIYESEGVRPFLNVCAEMLKHTDSYDPDKKRQVNGELCEIVLMALTDNYIKKRHISAGLYHSMILANKNNKESSFRTELDFTLVAPSIILSGECKSYKGNITLVDDCTIRRNKDTDVARQMRLHGNALVPYLKEYALGNIGGKVPPYGLFLFVYSLGTIEDLRTKDNKAKFPVCQISNLYAYYDTVFQSYCKRVYDFDRACRQFSRFTTSATLHQQHKDYLGY